MTRILVVEDEAIVAMELAQTLTQMGHEVLATVATGEEAVRRASEQSPDLVLMDIHLRGPMDGIEAADRIRDRHDIPVIYLTAFSDVQTLKRAKATRPLGYLVKPYEERELGAAVEVALYNHRLEKERAEAMASLRRSEARYRLLAENAGDIIALTAPDGTIQYISAASASLLGYAPEDLIGKNGASFIHPPDLEGLVQEEREEASGEPGRLPRKTCTYRARRKDGALVWLESAVQKVRPDNDPEKQILLSVTRDVTARVQREEEYLRHQAQLEERLRDRESELRMVDQERSAFAKAAQEIDAALRQVADLVALAEAECGPRAPPAGRDALAQVRLQVHRLTTAVHGLLPSLRRRPEGRR